MADSRPQTSYGEPFPPLLTRSLNVPNSRTDGSLPTAAKLDDEDLDRNQRKCHHHNVLVESEYTGLGVVDELQATTKPPLAPDDVFETDSVAALRDISGQSSHRSRRSRHKKAWKKLLWVKQQCKRKKLVGTRVRFGSRSVAC